MFVDRPYQTEYVTAAREAVRSGARKIIICAPVGSGKTHCAARIMGLSVANGKRCLFLAPARELVNQCSRKLDDSGIEHGIIMAGRGYNFGAPVQVSCTPSLLSQGVRRGVIDMPPAELIVIDECHISGPHTADLIRRYPQAVIVGLSATPAKSDGRGLGGPGGYQRIIQAVKRSELIARGYITATRVFAPYRPNMKLTKEERERGERPTGSDGDYRSKFSERRMDKPELVGDIIAQWQRLGQGRPTICFACSVDHSRHVCARFLMAGVPAVHLEAKSPEEHRRRALDGLAEGSVKILCNFGVAVSGIDVPAVGCIVLARPTKSIIVWTQAVGRGVRSYPGPLYAKDACTLIDHSGCWEVHGRPDDDIEWELSPDRKVQDKVKKENEDAPKQVKCKFCHAVFDYRPTCPHCGRPVERPRKGKEVKENKAGVLVEIPDGHPQADAMKLQQYTRLWHRCLAGASARDGTVYEAVARFKKEAGVWPTGVRGLVNVPRSQEELYDKVRRVYPGYHDPDARPPRRNSQT